MRVSAFDFVLKLENATVAPDSPCYRPPSWPPPDDWVVSEDANGEPVSRWTDDFWDLSFIVGYRFKLNFSGAPHTKATLGTKNQRQLRLLTTWMIWGQEGARAALTLKGQFLRIRRIVVVCEKNNILAADLIRFPKVLEQVADLFKTPKEQNAVILLLDRLRRARGTIGFELLDEEGISELARTFADSAAGDVNYRKVEQTAYIPTRIWTYQLRRLREFLDDFLQHRNQIEECFAFCLDAYAHNFGSLENALRKGEKYENLLPFSDTVRKDGSRTGRRYPGPFIQTAENFEIDTLLRKWVAPKTKEIDIKSLGAYLTLVQAVGHAYIVNFTFQRKEEAAGLRADCLLWEDDPLVGSIPLIRGETTKTDPDSDARWPTSPHVEVAIDAMTAVAKMRLRCAAAIPEVNLSAYDKGNPFLINLAYEPWASGREYMAYANRSKSQTYLEYVARFPHLFDPAQLTITEEDLQEARKFTPNLHKHGKFAVGKIWPLAYHQCRRTGAVNMFASGLMSDSSIQVVLKHHTLLQSRYYGQNFTRLRINEEYQALVTDTRYEVIGREMRALIDANWVSPLGEERKEQIIVELVGEKDFDTLVKEGREGKISFRPKRLGGCAKPGHCPYGGIEAVAPCAGDGRRKPCNFALFDRRKRSSVERQLRGVEEKIKAAKAGSPRVEALKAEADALRSYLNAIGN